MIDPQSRLIEAVKDQIGDATVTGRVPDDLPKPAVVIQTGRAGTSDGVTTISYQNANVYHPTRDGAVALMAEARDAILSQSGHALPDGSGLLDVVKVDTEPVEIFHSADVTELSAAFSVAYRDR